MRILVLSDNHFHNIDLDLENYDYIIHAGDYGIAKATLDKNKALYVRGNCDYAGEKERLFTINNKKIYLTHGDLYDVKYSRTRLTYRALELEASLCIYGHTHIPDVIRYEDLLILNPGAYKDGYYLEINDNSIEFYLNNKCYKKLDYRW